MAVATESQEPVFRLDDLTVNFRGQSGPVPSPLQGLNLDIRANEITTILGASGCGKSTLLRTLGGFVIPEDTGGVLYKKQFLTGPTTDIVMIFQENNLYPWLTVKGNVRFGLRFRKNAPEDLDKAVADMLSNVGLSDAARAYPHQLSGGMRQRTAIARALITRPRVLLLDEPFSALDISLKRRMHSMIHTLQEETDISMVMVTHDVEEAITVGDRVLVLGGNPANVLVDADARGPEMRDRYSKEYLNLQKKIEEVIF
ncbi:ABC transporter ATP-binding protein [Marinobacter sp. F3R08]|uniref:ABC transporter ATP-binding protein n=1 Tax=Marinobacter sp. F3R08 TaxID=2841559 RepID=UPI001C09F472|nr:ATP-binding cassette domain-containing protein [Marinobacter sp. F3R08]MBU2954796.1 ATP-binding cassette domain-containing protein [Marinobacter sp. F3R08]